MEGWTLTFFDEAAKLRVIAQGLKERLDAGAASCVPWPASTLERRGEPAVPPRAALP